MGGTAPAAPKNVAPLADAENASALICAAGNRLLSPRVVVQRHSHTVQLTSKALEVRESYVGEKKPALKTSVSPRDAPNPFPSPHGRWNSLWRPHSPLPPSFPASPPAVSDERADSGLTFDDRGWTAKKNGRGRAVRAGRRGARRGRIRKGFAGPCGRATAPP